MTFFTKWHSEFIEIWYPYWTRISTVALPPSGPRHAALKCISRNTSYRKVWLAFHSYSQVITILYNGYVFGPLK